MPFLEKGEKHMLVKLIEDNAQVLIKSKANLSFAGTVLKYEKSECGTLYLVIKPSKRSMLLIYIPFDEIESVYLINGNVIVGEELYEYI